MKNYKNNKFLTKKEKFLNTILIFIWGVSLGIFSKWLDSLPINASVSWHRFVEIIDLGNVLSELPIWILLATTIAVLSKSSKRAALNVFIFFIGMNSSYHIYTVYVCGFNPKSYMDIWYTITFLSPLLAIFCWYAKKDSKFSMISRVCIFTTMMIFVFYLGWIYISFGRIFNFIFLTMLIVILWKGLKEITLNLLLAVVLRIIISLVFLI